MCCVSQTLSMFGRYGETSLRLPKLTYARAQASYVVVPQVGPMTLKRGSNVAAHHRSIDP